MISFHNKSNKHKAKQKMIFKHVIGLDIGTNSLGWCLIKEYENGKIEIIKTGVHIFPIGTIVDDVSNKEKTKNEQRRAYRGASRLRYRFKLRRKNLKQKLADLGMLPEYEKLYKYYKFKDIFNFFQIENFQRKSDKSYIGHLNKNVKKLARSV